MNTRKIIEDYNAKPHMDQRLCIRVRNEEYEKIKEYVKADPERFDSESHFVRVAIMRLIREEQKTKPNKASRFINSLR